MALSNTLEATQGKVASAQFRRACSAWMTYRDAKCEYVAMTAGGDQGPAAYGKALEECLVAKTMSRLEDLRRLAPRPK